MTNWITSGNGHIIDTFKTGEDTFIKTVAKVYTKYISETLKPQHGKTGRW